MTTATVTPLTADMVVRLRGPRRHAPVQVGHTEVNGDPTVVMVLDPGHAQALAKVLALFDAKHPAGGLDFEFDGPTWTHAMVDLLAAAAMATGRHAEVAAVAAFEANR